MAARLQLFRQFSQRGFFACLQLPLCISRPKENSRLLPTQERGPLQP